MVNCSKDNPDVFYRQAKEEGWRARSAFKLLQIDDKFSIFKGVTRAVDLCAAPGSWSQVLAKKLRNNKQTDESAKTNDRVEIVAVDIQSMAPIEGVTLLQGDITAPETAVKILNQFSGSKAQLVICDGAPDVTGLHDLDEFIQYQLILAALNITTFILEEEEGTFVAKIFRGKDITLMINQLRIFFEIVTVVKPESSRTSSIESFVICRKFRLPAGYKPQLFNLSKKFEDDCWMRQVPEGTTRNFIPYLMCGDLRSLQPSDE